MVVRIKACFDFAALWVVSAGVWLFIVYMGEHEYWVSYIAKGNWTSLVVQLLRLHTSIAWGIGLIPTLGTKILYATAKKKGKAEKPHFRTTSGGFELWSSAGGKP